MSGPMRYRDPELQSQLAAEYVLGTLRGLARKRFEALMTDDPTLAAHVRRWEQQLQQLHQVTAEVPPSPEVWEGIRKQIRGSSTRPEAVQDSLLKRLRFYRWFSAASFACVLLLSLTLWAPWQTGADPAAAPVSYVAVMKDEIGDPSMVATLVQDGRRLRLDLLKKPRVPENQQLQLWAQSREDGRFRSLGNLPLEKQSEATLSREEWGLIRSAEYLVVSVEAPGELALQPSPEIIARGLCVRVEGWKKQAG